MKLPITSWLSALIMRDNKQQKNIRSFGKVWHGPIETKKAASIGGGDQLRICFRNLTDEPFLLCWIDEHGGPHHYYILDPYTGKTNDDNNNTHEIWMSADDGDHIETTCCGHAFLVARSDDVKLSSTQETLKDATLIGAYSAKRVRPKFFRSNNNDDDDENIVHLVTVHDETITPQNIYKRIRRLRGCCPPNCNNDDNKENSDDNDNNRYYLNVRVVTCDRTPIDTTTIVKYDKCVLGKCEWPVYLEPNWYCSDTKMKEIFENDLDYAISYLPEHCRDVLKSQSATPIWISNNLEYGPKACPIKGRGMCFHPDVDYLIENGLHKEKCECVEVYGLKDYMSDRGYWGTGGSLLHEFSHAYHHKCLKDGYDNKDVIACYKNAMKKKLYDNVRVHGPQGPSCRAYACTNHMEYFAELSTAFLGGIPRQNLGPNSEEEKIGTEEEIEEYNKWYPFNRQQIKVHDPKAYEMLKRVWKVQDD